MRVHEAAAHYMQTLNAISGQTNRDCQEATDYAKMHLASLNLPAALEVTYLYVVVLFCCMR